MTSESVSSKNLVTLPKLVFILNVTLFLVCLGVGYWLYADRVAGAGDDWKFFNPNGWPSEWAFLRNLYLNVGGRVGSYLILMLFRLLSFFYFTPDSFPWWVLYSVSLFCTLAMPLNLVAAGQRLTNSRWIVSLFLLAWIYLVWATNFTVFGVTLLAVTVSGRWPLYMLSLGIWLLSTPPSSRVQWLRWGGLSLLYLIASLSIEQILTSIPVLFAAVSLIKGVRQRKPPSGWIWQIGLWAGLSVIALLIYLASPGQLNRSSTAPQLMFDLSLWQKILNWYKETVKAGYDTLFTGSVSYSVYLNSLILILLILALGIVSLASYRARQRDLANQQLLDDLFSLNLLALTFMVAFISSLVHLFFSPYFPWYARMYPALLLAVGLGFSLLLLVRLVNPAMQQELLEALTGLPSLNDDYKGSVQISDPIINLLSIFLLSILLFNITMPNLERNINIYRREVWLTAIRRQAYQTIVNTHYASGQVNFRLSRCPPGLESTWGLVGYFDWRGYPELSVILDGDGDTQSALGEKNWDTVECVVPPLYPWKWANNNIDATSAETETREVDTLGTFLAFPWRWSGNTKTTPPLVRSVVYYDAEGQGAWDYDFWVPEGVTHCTLIGAYNPNAGGHVRYQETFEYRVIFGNGWNHVNQWPMRLIESYPVGSVHWSDATVSINYFHDNQLVNQVPLMAFGYEPQERPLVRISIKDVGTGWLAGWMTAYSDVRMNCL